MCKISFYLSLTVGVLITTHPQDKLVNVSDNVTFTCEASGSPPINYRWLYNGNYIMDDPGHIEGANTDTLMIINVLVTDWGIYSCEATNIVNNATSDNATLHGEYGYTISYLMELYFAASYRQDSQETFVSNIINELHWL